MFLSNFEIFHFTSSLYNLRIFYLDDHLTCCEIMEWICGSKWSWHAYVHLLKKKKKNNYFLANAKSFVVTLFIFHKFHSDCRNVWKRSNEPVIIESEYVPTRKKYQKHALGYLIKELLLSISLLAFRPSRAITFQGKFLALFEWIEALIIIGATFFEYQAHYAVYANFWLSLSLVSSTVSPEQVSPNYFEVIEGGNLIG